MADAAYQFLSYVRSGFAASIGAPDTLGAAQSALATAAVALHVSGAPDVHRDVAVHGPGDVVGISSAQVVRSDPIDGATGVEPNYFALVEFDRPDLPWMFTPAAARPDGRLRPWLVLVVVDVDGPAGCRLVPAAPLPRLSIPVASAGQLPDLADSALWAHAQVVVPDGQTLDQALTGDPRLAVARLLCPRHLDPDRRYLAVVVPAFEVGRLAGLGIAVTPQDEAALTPAWTPGAAVELPVYHSWHFGTGADADFESLARKLTGRPLPAGVGTRPLDVSRPGAGLPGLPAPVDTADTIGITWLDGALRPLDSDSLPARDPAAVQQLATGLTVLLDRPAELIGAGLQDPVVAPPIYGDKHALVVRLDAGSPPPWVSELNLDPRTRVAAGLGTQVVQARQEDYVARSWRQLGDVLAANRLLRAAQLARTGSLRLHERLATLAPETLVTLASPAHGRVVGVTAGQVTLATAIRRSRLPEVTVEPAFRRVARAGTAAARAAGSATLASVAVQRFTAEVFTAPVDGPDGATSMRPASEVLGALRTEALLTALGVTTGSADELVGALNQAAVALPTGDLVRAATLRQDTGAVAALTGLGAVPAPALAAVLEAAIPAQAPPAAPVHPVPPQPGPGPVVHPPGPVLHPLGPQLHLPHGLAGTVEPTVTATHPAAGTGHTIEVGALLGRFTPAGPAKTLPHGVGVLRGGSISVGHDLAGRLTGATVPAIDDTRWAQLADGRMVPRMDSLADPVTDIGSRLDLVRKDPVALTALGQVAVGDPFAAQTLDRAAGELVITGSGATTISALATGTFRANLPVVAALVTEESDLTAARDLVASVAVALDRFVRIDDSPPVAAGPVLDLARTRSALLAKVDPTVTVSARIGARLSISVLAGIERRDDLDPVMASPVLDDPMWLALRDLGSGWLLPGLEKVPPDTATLVRTNPGFVTAHMVGLNHEMMRELLWREYPTDQRGTPFTRFWGRLPVRPGDPVADIRPVHTFTKHLTNNLVAGRTGETVLLLRSELLRRYPGSIIYLARAHQSGADLVLDDADPARTLLPVFRGDLPPDVSFVGFPLEPQKLRVAGDPWYFVIAQPPAEPRFGLDDASPVTPPVPSSSNDLAWSHMVADGDGSHAAFAVSDPPTLRGVALDGGLRWGSNSGVMAHLTYQHPVRVAIRATDMLPPEVHP